MAQKSDNLDFNTIFKLEVIQNLNIKNYVFYEVGLKKLIALASDKEFVFIYINAQSERLEKNYYWDFIDNPIHCLCFEPSGTWLVVISDQKVLLVPFLPLFIPNQEYDCKWSLSSVTVLPLLNVEKPVTVLWWLTKESENNILVGSKSGIISFFSLESHSIVGETKVSDEITDLQMCFDDSLDVLTLLITGIKCQQWKLILEHRSLGYNWLRQIQAQPSSRTDTIISYIKQLSKDKITLFTQGSSKDSTKSQSVEYVLKPTEYLPSYRKNSNCWTLAAQYVNGRHFLTAFELNEGTLIIESPDQDVPSKSLRPILNKDGIYVLALYSQRLVYLFKMNSLEIHSSANAVQVGKQPQRDTLLWSTDIQGTVRRAFIMSTRESQANHEWKEPTFLSDLQLPRFTLQPCLIITTTGAYIFKNVVDPCEWLVSWIVRGSRGAERAALALGAPLQPLLKGGGDVLMAKGKLTPAQYLYTLSQCSPDFLIARYGVFGRTKEVIEYKMPQNTGNLSNSAIMVKLLAALVNTMEKPDLKIDLNTNCTMLSCNEFAQISILLCSLGLWNYLPMFSINHGHPTLILDAMKNKEYLCRGAFYSLMRQPTVATTLLMNNGEWFLEYLVDNCHKFDLNLLKSLCLWLNPLQDQLRPVLRDLKDDIVTTYTTKLINLIKTFMHIASVIENHNPSTDITTELPIKSDTWKSTYEPKKQISCGLSHWAVCDEGNCKIFGASTEVPTELVGRVISVACGRHHTLVLTENGMYSSGDNSLGQLGVGSTWAGGCGDAASAGGTLRRVEHKGGAPIEVIACGHYHSAAVDRGGRLYTWGWNVHGQLGLGTIEDESTPQVVTRLQGRKIKSVGCGACHTVVLTNGGEVFSFGANVFGQLGNGGKEKSSVPIRIRFPDAIQQIAVGYFHNLAQSSSKLYTWGGSPQWVRASLMRRIQGQPQHHDEKQAEPHLAPSAVDLSNVVGNVEQISAGWHHSCLVDSNGDVFTWGLNFDGQLGSGDRKQIPIPTKAKFHEAIPTDLLSDDKQEKRGESQGNSLVGCGGDFTLFVDYSGKIFAAGNPHYETTTENTTTSKVIMMKTTKRVIKIPTVHANNKFVFRQIDRIDIMFPFDTNESRRSILKSTHNPLKEISDFDSNKAWSSELIILLLPWIEESTLTCNKNMAAKFAYHNNRYSDCLRLLLENLTSDRPNKKTYFTHDFREMDTSVAVYFIKEYIKNISLSILNEKPSPNIDLGRCRSLQCICDERSYLPINNTNEKTNEYFDISIEAASIIDKCIDLFPVDAKLWESCFCLAKDFYLEHSLNFEHLERVLTKYMEKDASTMAKAIMYSSDCVQFSKILSPKLYLNMCNGIIGSWS